MTQFMPDPSWPTIVELAIERWGSPNATLSKRDGSEVRFGTNGSKSVKPVQNIWRDHEVGEGGGYVGMHHAVRGELPPRSCKANGKANGHAASAKPRQRCRDHGTNIAATYDYRNADGEIVLQVVRTQSGKPRFRQRVPDGNGGWWAEGIADPPLYRLPTLRASGDATVWITEGEKDADRLHGEGLVATTNCGGARKWRDEYTQEFRDKPVVVLQDNDQVGRDHVAEVALSLVDVAASIKVLLLPGLPPKGDVSNWFDADGTAEELVRLARETPEYQPPRIKGPNGSNNANYGTQADRPEPGRDEARVFDLPPGYALRADGLFFIPQDSQKKPVWVCAPFEIVGESRDEHSCNWALVLKWSDRDGVQHQLPIPKELAQAETTEMFRALQSAGLACATSQQAHGLFRRFVVQATSRNRLLSVARSGWHRTSNGMVFILPDGTVFGAGAGSLILRTITADDYRPSGSLAEWQNEIARYAVGNDLLLFGHSLAFTGPLLELLGESTNSAFNLNGGSQTGKTTAQRAAVSAWGVNKENENRTLLRSWRTTANGLEAICSEANDLLLGLNELGEVGAGELSEIVYMIGNGSGKARASRTGGPRERLVFRLMALSSGEMTLAAKLVEAGQRSRGGQEVRLIEVVAGVGQYGVFQELHGRASGGALAEALNSAASRFYGTAGRAFLERLVAERASDEAGLVLRIRDKVNEFLDGRLKPGSAPAVRSVGRRFGLVAAAGELAVQYGVLPWEQGEAIRGVGACFARWRDGRRGGSGSLEDAEMLGAVRSFIEAHGESRFTEVMTAGCCREETLGTNRPSLQRAGFRRKNAAGDWEYLVFPEAWRNEVCKGLDCQQVAALLLHKGLLLNKPEENGHQPKIRIPNHGRLRLYRISPEILGGRNDA